MSIFSTSTLMSLSMLSEEYPLPKSSMSTVNPRSAKASNAATMRSGRSEYALSVISTSMSDGSMP